MQHVQIHLVPKVFFSKYKKHFLAFEREILNVVLFTSINISWLQDVQWWQNISVFSPPGYYTFFETKLVANSINKVIGKKSKEKKRTALNKGKNHSLLFSVEMLISFCITKTFELRFYGCRWEVGLFLLCIKENNLSSSKKTYECICKYLFQIKAFY